jgi:hypothetical protein
MTTADRGAYAPQHDGPSMSFDPRRSRSRQPAPFTLIFSGVVLVALLAAIFMFYRGGVREAGAPPATVGDPVVAMKGPAVVDAAPMGAEESLDVYVGSEEQAAAMTPPAFAAPPEQPQPRPAPRPAPAPVAVAAAPVTTPARPAAAQPAPAVRPAQVAKAAPRPAAPATASASRPVQTAAAAPAPAAKPVQVAAAAPVAASVSASSLPVARANPAPAAVAAGAQPAASKPLTVAAVTPTAAPVVTAPRPAPVAAPVAAAAVKTAPAVASAGGYGVQIGAFSSQAQADREFAKVAGSFGVAGRGKVITPVQAKGATVYRTVVTGFGSREQAATVCAQIKASGRDCFVKGS